MRVYCYLCAVLVLGSLATNAGLAAQGQVPKKGGSTSASAKAGAPAPGGGKGSSSVNGTAIRAGSSSVNGTEFAPKK